MNKKGLTLVELLGALVLFGMIASLSAVMISTIMKSNARIVEQSRAHNEKMLLTAYLDQTIQTFNPTNYTSCTDPNCLILIKEFDYIANLETGTINLVIFNPERQFKIELINQELHIDLITYNLQYFTIDPNSSITSSLSGSILNYSIDLVFIGEYDTYSYSYSNSLQTESIPIG
jgi:type II secretory pathway pseudopilin PulG